ncbi:MAG: hypothetical protein ACHRXM_13480 [Isosphaerales bacterium]
MILVLVLGGGLGWIVHRAQIQRDAVAAIQRAGDSAFYEWDFRDGVILPFFSAQGDGRRNGCWI